MEKEEIIKLWERKIEEIKRTGNFLNSNVHRPEPYFSGVKHKYTEAQMIAYCESMIERVRNRED